MALKIKLSENCFLDQEREVLIRDGREIPISDRDLRVLEALIRSNGQPVYYETLEECIWPGVNEGYDVQDRRKAVRNSLSRLRKAIGEDCFRVKRGESAALNTAPAQEEPVTVALREEALPHELTNTAVPYTDDNDILHRDRELKKLERTLKQGKQAILLSGVGGVGKTTLARCLYFRMEKEYDSVGWVEYRGDLKSSLLSDLDLEEQIENQEVRWGILRRRLQRDQSKKLIIIDNVDRDASQRQDPAEDKILRSISGWPNTTVLLTSRLEELPGYRSWPVDCLDEQSCEDIFYHYYNRAELRNPPMLRAHRETVRALVDRAGCHTYAVELLAKSAKYEENLETYLEKIRTLGFRFPKLNIRTNHRGARTDAASQLHKLFDLRTRDGLEQQVLWDFSVLPHTELSFREIGELLGYGVNDLDRLISEGWLTYRGGVSMHPLVRETMYLDRLTAPQETAQLFLERMEQGTLITPQTPLSETGRLLSFARHVLVKVDIPQQSRRIMLYRRMGEQCRRKGLISEAETYLHMALNWQEYEAQQRSANIRQEQLKLAECCQELGYLLSYTNGRRDDAEHCLRRALAIYDAVKSGREEWPQQATVCGYLGYLLSDRPESRVEGEGLLRRALELRCRLEGEEPGVWAAQVAWSRDDLGYLLACCPDRFDEAERELRRALELRTGLESRNPGAHLSEVAWSCNNLATLYHRSGVKSEQAEELYRRALEICRKRERIAPGTARATMAIQCGNLGVLLLQRGGAAEEAEGLFREALKINRQLEEEQRGVYCAEVAVACVNLAAALLGQRNADKRLLFPEMADLYREALTIFQMLENMRPDCFTQEIADVEGNLRGLERLEEVLEIPALAVYVQSGSRKIRLSFP